jgi:hypothetical protein
VSIATRICADAIRSATATAWQRGSRIRRASAKAISGVNTFHVADVASSSRRATVRASNGQYSSRTFAASEYACGAGSAMRTLAATMIARSVAKMAHLRNAGRWTLDHVSPNAALMSHVSFVRLSATIVTRKIAGRARMTAHAERMMRSSETPSGRMKSHDRYPATGGASAEIPPSANAEMADAPAADSKIEIAGGMSASVSSVSA